MEPRALEIGKTYLFKERNILENVVYKGTEKYTMAGAEGVNYLFAAAEKTYQLCYREVCRFIQPL